MTIAKGTADNQISGSFGIVVDAERIYVADTPTHKVKVFSKTGAFLLKIAQRGTVKGKLLQPDGLALYGGRLYVCEEGNERISVFNLNQL